MSAPTARRPGVLALARRYARRRVARELDGMEAAGVAPAREVARIRPIILAANHVAWWDAFLLVLLDEALGTEGYALMEQRNLQRLPYFGWLGAIPLDPAAPLPGLREGARLLNRESRAVWIFPQGRQTPAHLRPLGFEPGIAMLARLAPQAAVIPVSIQYAFGEGPRPGAFAVLGKAVPGADLVRPGGVARLEAAVESGLEQIDQRLRGAGGGFETVVRSARQDAQDGLGARLLAGWAGRRP